MSKFRLSVIIPVWGERSDFVDVLAQNINVFQSLCFELVISTDSEYCRKHGGALTEVLAGMKGANIVICNERVTKGRLINIAYAYCSSDLILCADCDILFTESAIEQMIEVAEKGGIAHVAEVINLLHVSDAPSSEVNSISTYVSLKMKNGEEVVVERSTTYPNRGARSGPGIICLARHMFLKAQGFNGRISGYGWEDLDFILRASYLNKAQSVPISCVYEKRSPTSREVIDSRLLSDSRNYVECLAAMCVGDFYGTLKDDVCLKIRSFFARQV